MSVAVPSECCHDCVGTAPQQQAAAQQPMGYRMKAANGVYDHTQRQASPYSALMSSALYPLLHTSIVWMLSTPIWLVSMLAAT